MSRAPQVQNASAPAAPARVDGSAIAYRLYDVGYEIDLDRAGELLADRVPERVRPTRGEAQALQISNPPLTIILDSMRLAVAGTSYSAELSARIFDFGTVSMRLSIAGPPGASWESFVAFGNAIDTGAELTPIFQSRLEHLLHRLNPAIERPAVSPLTEDYVVYRLHRMTDEAGSPFPPGSLRDHDLIRLLVGERRPLSESARSETLANRFAYYEDDLTVLTWDNALMVEPNTEDSDVQYVLEFANAQLLELRIYDATLEAELAKMRGRIQGLQAAPARVLRRHTPLLREIHTLLGDLTELVERVENSLKVTDDVYLARVYRSAIGIFRGSDWRAGIDRKLTILRDTYTMMNVESQAARSELLELTIIALIGLEIALALLHLR